MLEDLKTSKDKVEALISQFEPLRDDDKRLWLAYLNVFHSLEKRLNNAENPWEELKLVLYDKDTPMPESIRRIRQKFQQDGLYLGKKRELMLEEMNRVTDYFRQ